MNNYREDLLKELLKENESQKNSQDLLDIAFKVNNLSSIRRSYEFKKSFLRKLQTRHSGGYSLAGRLQNLKKQILFPKIFAISFAVIILFISFAAIATAQKSIPGDVLYPVKVMSEKVIKKVNPQFKEEVIKRRTEEIKKSTENKQNPQTFNHTIENYKEEIKNNEKEKDQRVQNAIKESKQDLEELKNKLPENQKKEIEKTIEHVNKSEEVKGEKVEEKGKNKENADEGKNDKKSNNKKD